MKYALAGLGGFVLAILGMNAMAANTLRHYPEFGFSCRIEQRASMSMGDDHWCVDLRDATSARDGLRFSGPPFHDLPKGN